MQHFISVKDVSNIDALAKQALAYKLNPYADRHLGANKRIGLLFLNPSLRTRISTQIAAENLGMQVLTFNVGNDGWKLEFEEEAIMSGTTVEHIKDAAPILGNYFDVIGVRSFPSLTNKEEDYSEHVIKQFIKYAGVPVVSLETATLHPLQSFTDIITIKETLLLASPPLEEVGRRVPKIVLAWAPHIKPLPQCVANSFAQWMNAWNLSLALSKGEEISGIDFVITHPEDYELDEQFTKGATVTNNQQDALKDADFVYVKNWSTYHDYGKIYSNDPSWMLTPEKLKVTKNAKIMHCLPVRRNVELSDEVLDSANSLVTQEASNRVWAAQAVLSEILKNVNK
jgi:N-succinyl-L-ornithine transcarbamylase